MKPAQQNPSAVNRLKKKLQTYSVAALALGRRFANGIGISETYRRAIVLIAKESGIKGVIGILLGGIAGFWLSLYSRSAVNTASETQAVTVDYATYLLYNQYWAIGASITVLFCAFFGWMFAFTYRELIFRK